MASPPPFQTRAEAAEQDRLEYEALSYRAPIAPAAEPPYRPRGYALCASPISDAERQTESDWEEELLNRAL